MEAASKLIQYLLLSLFGVPLSTEANSQNAKDLGPFDSYILVPLPLCPTFSLAQERSMSVRKPCAASISAESTSC